MPEHIAHSFQVTIMGTAMLKSANLRRLTAVWWISPVSIVDMVLFDSFIVVWAWVVCLETHFLKPCIIIIIMLRVSTLPYILSRFIYGANFVFVSSFMTEHVCCNSSHKCSPEASLTKSCVVLGLHVSEVCEVLFITLSDAERKEWIGKTRTRAHRHFLLCPHPQTSLFVSVNAIG